jgi:Encapsulating protein for peroxidase
MDIKGRVALPPVRERDLVLARQLFRPQFPILRARHCRKKDMTFGRTVQRLQYASLSFGKRRNDGSTRRRVRVRHRLRGGRLTTRGGDFSLHIGQDVSIGYSSHTDAVVRLYLQDTFTFLLLTTEAAVELAPLGTRGRIPPATVNAESAF